MTIRIRRGVFLCLCLLFPAACVPADTDSLQLIRRGEAEAIRKAVQRHDPAVRPFVEVLRRRMEADLKAGPWSVTFHRPPRPGIALNDFYSEGPYWWPDPKNPGGPFIRRDGERYPGRFVSNDDDLRSMGMTLMILGMGANFLGESRCADRAALIVDAWFLNPKTRMNPHLEHGQAIPGINDGRGAGIIDTVPLIWALQGIHLLKDARLWNPEREANVRSWFAAYLRWLTTSPKGLEEKGAKNNHGTWWTAQVAAFSLYLDDPAAQHMAWDRVRDFLVPSQIRADGSCPLEEARTRSLSYSAMNLNGLALLCRMAELKGVDLWKTENKEKGSILRAIAYLTPFVQSPETWKKQQITKFQPEAAYFHALDGLALGSREYLELYQRLARTNDEPVYLLLHLLLGAVRRQIANAPGFAYWESANGGMHMTPVTSDVATPTWAERNPWRFLASLSLCGGFL